MVKRLKGHTLSGNSPLISIVTPSFNQALFLENCLESVTTQDYARKELLVVDGGSSDGSLAILEGQRGAFSYFRSHPDGGQAAAINEGLAKAKGDILGWVNSDDGLLPGALRTVVAHLGLETPAWIIGDAVAKNATGRVVRTRRGRAVDDVTFIRYKEYWLPQPSIFWNRAMQERVGFLDESLHYAMDVDWFFRMYRVARPIYIAELLSFYTVHEKAKTTAMADSVDREYAAWLERRIREGAIQIDVLLDDFVYLQRCHRTLAEHPVLSRCARLWKRLVNPRIHI